MRTTNATNSTKIVVTPRICELCLGQCWPSAHIPPSRHHDSAHVPPNIDQFIRLILSTWRFSRQMLTGPGKSFEDSSDIALLFVSKFWPIILFFHPLHGLEIKMGVQGVVQCNVCVCIDVEKHWKLENYMQRTTSTNWCPVPFRWNKGERRHSRL